MVGEFFFFSTTAHFILPQIVKVHLKETGFQCLVSRFWPGVKKVINLDMLYLHKTIILLVFY